MKSGKKVKQAVRARLAQLTFNGRESFPLKEVSLYPAQTVSKK